MIINLYGSHSLGERLHCCSQSREVRPSQGFTCTATPEIPSSVWRSLSPTLSWSVKEYSEADWFLIRLTTWQTIRHGAVEIPFNHRQEFLLSHRLQVRIRNAKIGRHAAVLPGHRCRPRERRRGRGRPEYRIMKLSGTNLVQYDYRIIRPTDISSQLQS